MYTVLNIRVFNYCQTSVLFLYKGATLLIYRAHGPYTLVGPTASRLALDPLVAFTLTTVDISNVYMKTNEKAVCIFFDSLGFYLCAKGAGQPSYYSNNL